jgi:hypothetical protein
VFSVQTEAPLIIYRRNFGSVIDVQPPLKANLSPGVYHVIAGALCCCIEAINRCIPVARGDCYKNDMSLDFFITVTTLLIMLTFFAFFFV